MFNGKIKEENRRLKDRNQQLESEIKNLKGRLDALDATTLEQAKENYKKLEAQLAEINAEAERKELALMQVSSDIERLLDGKEKIENFDSVTTAIIERQQVLTELEEQVLMETYALYSPHYNFKSSDEYRTRIDQIRSKQRELLRTKKAVNYVEGWEIDGSKELGQKLNDDNIQKLIRCFNSECDLAIKNVRFNNFDRMETRIKTAYDTLNTLNEMSQVSITPAYLQLKLDELAMSHEYQLKLQAEADERRTLREQQREDATARRDIDSARRRLVEEKTKLTKELEEAKAAAEASDPEEFPEFTNRLHEIEAELIETEKNEAELKARLLNRRAGFVYVLSNTGSFGGDVFKIGMTRRLDTDAFVDEFNCPSVPFNFDVHAMLYADDARSILDELQKRLAPRRINMVNAAKDYYRIDAASLKAQLDDVFGKCVEFDIVAPAEQYRNSVRLAQAGIDQ